MVSYCNTTVLFSKKLPGAQPANETGSDEQQLQIDFGSASRKHESAERPAKPVFRRRNSGRLAKQLHALDGAFQRRPARAEQRFELDSAQPAVSRSVKNNKLENI